MSCSPFQPPLPQVLRFSFLPRVSQSTLTRRGDFCCRTSPSEYTSPTGCPGSPRLPIRTPDTFSKPPTPLYPRPHSDTPQVSLVTPRNHQSHPGIPLTILPSLRSRSETDLEDVRKVGERGRGWVPESKGCSSNSFSEDRNKILRSKGVLCLGNRPPT